MSGFPIDLRVIEPISVSTNTTLLPSQVRGQIVYVSGAATVTLPAVSDCGVGCSVSVYTVGAIAVSVDPDSADRIVLDGTALADGNKATNNSTAGDMITLHADSADGWTMVGRAGTWSDGGA